MASATNNHDNTDPDERKTKKGKNICKQLKAMRRQFADANGINFQEDECTYDGPCEGTCPYCDSKTNELLQKSYQLAGAQQVEYPHVSINKTTETSIADDIDTMMDGQLSFPFDETPDTEDIVEKEDIIRMGEIDEVVCRKYQHESDANIDWDRFGNVRFDELKLSEDARRFFVHDGVTCLRDFYDRSIELMSHRHTNRKLLCEALSELEEQLKIYERDNPTFIFN